MDATQRAEIRATIAAERAEWERFGKLCADLDARRERAIERAEARERERAKVQARAVSAVARILESESGPRTLRRLGGA